MSKISKAFKALGMIVRRPYLLNLINDDEQVKKNYVEHYYRLGDGLPTVDIMHYMPEGEDIFPYSFLEGSSLPTDFALLRGICRKNNVEDYLEIGTWRGESVANVAPLAKNCYTLNLPDEEMRKSGLDEAYIAMHRFFSKDFPNVTHLQANSMTFDFASLNKKFDLIFLDGDHHAEAVAHDTRTAFSLLKDEKSVIVWHDYGLSTETPRYDVLSGILDGCPPNCIEHLYHVSNTLCALFTREKLPASFISPNTRPQKQFEIKIHALACNTDEKK
ncbi:MAG TPA: class I SAM-dependent methyltransferase [Bacteroidales bacterium]|nr:class I SAM-dependent methyltransferase [Bacteroidales bacterium]